MFYFCRLFEKIYRTIMNKNFFQKKCSDNQKVINTLEKLNSGLLIIGEFYISQPFEDFF